MGPAGRHVRRRGRRRAEADRRTPSRSGHAGLHSRTSAEQPPARPTGDNPRRRQSTNRAHDTMRRCLQHHDETARRPDRDGPTRREHPHLGPQRNTSRRSRPDTETRREQADRRRLRHWRQPPRRAARRPEPLDEASGHPDNDGLGSRHHSQAGTAESGALLRSRSRPLRRHQRSPEQEREPRGRAEQDRRPKPQAREPGEKESTAGTPR